MTRLTHLELRCVLTALPADAHADAHAHAAPAAAAADDAAGAATACWRWGERPLPGSLRSLSLSLLGWPHSWADLRWLGACAALTALTARGPWLAWPGAQRQLGALPNIQVLDLHFGLHNGAPPDQQDAAWDVLAAAAAWSRLRVLSLTAYIDGGAVPWQLRGRAEGILQNLRLLSRLERLELGHPLSGAAALLLPFGTLSGLTSLVVHASVFEAVTDAHLSHLELLPRLLRLEIFGRASQAALVPNGPTLTGAGLAPLARLGALETLRINHCFCFAAAGARAAGQLAASLRRLDLSYCSALDDGCVFHLRLLTRLSSAWGVGRGCVRHHPSARHTQGRVCHGNVEI
jgi:hypothetical protein